MLSTLAVGYLFLGGAGAGACLVACIWALFIPADQLHPVRIASQHASTSKRIYIPQLYRRLFAPMFLAAAAGLALGSFMLLVDLGDPDLAFMLFIHPTTAWLSVGAFSLVVCLVLSIVLACLWGFVHVAPPLVVLRILEGICAIAAAFVILYTGLLLATIQTVPLWNTPLVPVLFVLSSLSCGCAVLICLVHTSPFSQNYAAILYQTIRADLAFLFCEMAAAIAFIVLLSSQPYEVATEGAHSLLFGELALPFIAGFGLCGIVIPGVAECSVMRTGSRSSFLLPLVCASVLVGAFCMRYSIVFAAAHPAVWAV